VIQQEKLGQKHSVGIDQTPFGGDEYMEELDLLAARGVSAILTITSQQRGVRLEGFA